MSIVTGHHGWFRRATGERSSDANRRRGGDEIGLNLEGAENVSVSEEIAGSYSESVVFIDGTENVSLEIGVLDNATDAPDVADSEKSA